MRSTKVDSKFLTGLYFYITEVQLSIDRSSWQEFKSYSKTRTPVQGVLGKIRELFEYSVRTDGEIRKPKIGFISKISAKKDALYENEQNFIFNCVSKLSDYLDAAEEPDRDSIVELRVNLADAAEILAARVSNPEKLDSVVDHFNQNDILDTKSIEELCDGNWLD